jgi:hypothetical protein
MLYYGVVCLKGQENLGGVIGRSVLFCTFCVFLKCSFKIEVIQPRQWWLTPVILATWEAEIHRIMVQGQPRQMVCKIPSPK